MEYNLISSTTLEGLTYIVNEYISKGWRPQGGPFVVDKKLWSGKPPKENGKLVAQAIVKNGKCYCKDREESPC